VSTARARTKEKCFIKTVGFKAVNIGKELSPISDGEWFGMIGVSTSVG
jgi:hypothetical protein